MCDKLIGSRWVLESFEIKGFYWYNNENITIGIHWAMAMGTMDVAHAPRHILQWVAVCHWGLCAFMLHDVRPILQKACEFIIDILKKISYHNYDWTEQIWPQICTCHGSSAPMTCAKLWPDWIIIFHVRAGWIFTRCGLWAHKTLVKCAPAPVDIDSHMFHV